MIQAHKIFFNKVSSDAAELLAANDLEVISEADDASIVPVKIACNTNSVRDVKSPGLCPVCAFKVGRKYVLV